MCLVKQIWMMPPALFLFLIFLLIFLSTHVGLPELISDNFMSRGTIDMITVVGLHVYHLLTFPAQRPGRDWHVTA